MALRRLRRGRRGGSREVVVFVHLSDPARKQMCSPEFVNDLCDRVMYPALQELDRRFGEGWCSEIEPSLVLEGPALGFKLTIVNAEMSTRVGEVFNRHWELEIDRVPPR